MVDDYTRRIHDDWSDEYDPSRTLAPECSNGPGKEQGSTV